MKDEERREGEREELERRKRDKGRKGEMKGGKEKGTKKDDSIISALRDIYYKYFTAYLHMHSYVTKICVCVYNV